MSKPKLSELVQKLRASAEKPVKPASKSDRRKSPKLPRKANVKLAPMEQPGPEDTARSMAARLQARMFVKAYIESGFNATEACRIMDPGLRAPHAVGHRLVKTPEVRDELYRQLKAIDVAGNTDAEYLFRTMRSMADASLFDYGIQIIDGRGDFTQFKPELLTPDQRANIRKLTFYENGFVRSVELASREVAVNMLNKCKNMYGDRPVTDTVTADALRQRMERAAKRVPALIEGTAEEVT